MKLYGIPNCDTVKKARAFLADAGCEVVFHDFKKQGVPEDRLAAWLGTAGWAMGMPAWVGTFWGGVAGFTSHVAHAGGPPFQIWALSRNLPHTIFIGSSAIFFAVSASFFSIAALRSSRFPSFC